MQDNILPRPLWLNTPRLVFQNDIVQLVIRGRIYLMLFVYYLKIQQGSKVN